MAMKNPLLKKNWAKFQFFRQKHWENSGIFLVSNVNSTKFPIFGLKFTKILTPKK
jgi:hypothetical protein